MEWENMELMDLKGMDLEGKVREKKWRQRRQGKQRKCGDRGAWRRRSSGVVAMLLCFVLVSGLAGCGSGKGSGKPDPEITGSYDGTSDIQTETGMKSEPSDVARGVGGEGMVDMNTEEYSYIQENRFLSVQNSPLSTFAADVDTASYSNVRRMLNAGQSVPTDAVRIEELVNYFHYDYPEPEAGEPFAVVTELADCPWNADSKLLLVGMQAKKLEPEELPPSNLVFLVDVSGSMEDPDKLPLVQTAFSLLTESLKPEDRVSIVTYASSDEVLLEGAAGDEGERIRQVMADLEAGGSTAGAAGIQTAYALAEKYFIEGGNNRVILATDGDLNVGVSSEGELTRLIEKEREDGVFLSVLGFGTENIKDNKMESVADHGNGNYSYIDSVAEARKVLVEEMGGTLFTVAKDVKFQVEFNPAKVKGYRLVGYENRLMAAEDFADDTKDAGEIGAGHRVTVLYEIVGADSEMEIDGADLKYQQPGQGMDSEEYLTVSVRYKEPDGDESTLLEYPVGEESVKEVLSDNMKLAAAVAQFGMLLRGSEYAGTASYAGIRSQVEEVAASADSDVWREFVQLVERAEEAGKWEE